MNNIYRIAASIFALAVLLTSCDKDDDDNPIVSLGEYEGGYFVLNESGGQGTPIVTYVSEDGEVAEDPFYAVNPTHNTIGTYLQDMFFDDTRSFIISGSANSVTVVDRYTLEYITTISANLNVPRYGTVENGKAYVTNMADWSSSTDDFVTVIDLTDYSTSTIAINNTAEHILSEDGKVYVANGYYGSGNAVSIINTSTNAITTVDLGDGNSPNSMDEEDGYLYVLTYNYSGNGKLFTISLSSGAIASVTDLPTYFYDPKNLQIEEGVAYFTQDNGVYSFGLSNTTVSETPMFSYESDSAFGVMYGFAVNNGIIYIADGGDFASNSSAYEYSLSGQLLKTVTTGVGPNSFHFN